MPRPEIHLSVLFYTGITVCPSVWLSWYEIRLPYLKMGRYGLELSAKQSESRVAKQARAATEQNPLFSFYSTRDDAEAVWRPA